MYENPFNQQPGPGYAAPYRGVAVAPTVNLMTKVYQWMTLGLGLTGATAMIVSSQEALLQLFFGTPLMWVMLLATVGMGVALSGFAARMPAAVAFVVFFAYSAIMGVSLAPIFIVYDLGTIAMTFFATAGTFAGMTLYGYATKKNLSGWGTLLMMGLIGIVVATIVNAVFYGFASNGLYWLVTYAGVLLFAALTAYDTQRIKDALAEQPGGATPQMAIQGATILYMDFVNLFIYLLRIFGGRDRD